MCDLRDSASVVLFSHDLMQVATGISKQSGLRKFFGGRVEVCDRNILESNDPEAVARSCAHREVREESGVRPEQWTCVTRYYERRRVVKMMYGRKILSQHFFLGVAEHGVQIPGPGFVRDDEMHAQKFIPVVDTLASWRPKASERLNPYHAIALAKCLLLVQKQTEGDGSFTHFQEMCHSLPDLRNYIKEVRDAIKLHHV